MLMYNKSEAEVVSSNSFQFENLKSVRNFLYKEVKIAQFDKILDLGAGDLRISKEISQNIRKPVFALDLKTPSKIPENIIFVEGNALNLPFRSHTFDAVAASFFFVWIKEIDKAVKEIKRVLKRNGVLIVLSEPLYKKRVCHPESKFNELYTKGLLKLGADFEVEETLKKNLLNLGFKIQFKKTQGKRVYSKDEIFEEIDFLLENNLIDLETAKFLRLEQKERDYEIELPIFYGFAFLP